ncbi:P-loop containing nucleoside triphosphate hydrolase protein [Ramicandelaber brevisporus]|nr:P-loop containing nucleoside triphosphate hydrolase protein [Ramicandelaber brevisporus]
MGWIRFLMQNDFVEPAKLAVDRPAGVLEFDELMPREPAELARAAHARFTSSPAAAAAAATKAQVVANGSDGSSGGTTTPWIILLRCAWLARRTLTWQFSLMVLHAFTVPLIPAAMQQFLKQYEKTWTRETLANDVLNALVVVGLGMFLATIASLFMLQFSTIFAKRSYGQVDDSITLEVFKRVINVRQSATSNDNGSSNSGNSGNNSDASKDNQHQSGQVDVVSLISNDGHDIGHFFNICHSIVTLPLQITLYTVSLSYIIGTVEALSVVCLMLVVLIPLTALFRLRTNLRRAYSVARDRRITLERDMLKMVRMLKAFAWEHIYRDKILNIVRPAEERILRKTMLWAAVADNAMTTLPVVLTTGAFMAVIFVPVAKVWWATGGQQVGEYGELDAAKAFATLALMLKLGEPFVLLTNVVSLYLEAHVAFERVSSYLNKHPLESDNIDPTLNVANGHANGHANESVVLRNASFSWSGKEQCSGDSGDNGDDGTDTSDESTGLLSAPSGFILSNISAEFKPNQVSLIVGQIASGKSSLLQGIIGDMPCTSGRQSSLSLPSLARGVAYVPQTSWLQNATIRDSITFGLPFEQARYNAIVEACALAPDLATFPAGDLVEVGSGGINLSGGQRARLSLARALYTSPDTHPVLLLDDVLSAVDAPTQKHLIEECLMKKEIVGEGRIVIMATHAVSSMLPHAHQVLVLENGSVAAEGSPGEVRSHPALLELLKIEAVEVEHQKQQEQGQLEHQSKVQLVTPEPESVAEQEEEEEEEEQSESNATAEQSEAARRETGRLIEEEHRYHGAVKSSHYLSFIDAVGGMHLVVAMFALFAFAQITVVVKDLILRSWLANSSSGNGNDNNPTSFLRVYASISASSMVLSYLADCVVYILCMKGSSVLHARLVKSLLRAPLSFYDTTPAGRIVTRFVKDVPNMDNAVPIYLSAWTKVLFGALASISMLVYSLPMLVLSSIPIITYVLRSTASLFVPANREVRRMSSLLRGRQLSAVVDALQGAHVIRAFGYTDRFRDEFAVLTDHQTTCWLTHRNSNRWFSIRCDMISSLMLLASAVGFIAIKAAAVLGWTSGYNVDVGLVGLTLAMVSSLNHTLNYSIRQAASLQVAMSNVERVRDYSDYIPSEAPDIVADYRPPVDGSWPRSRREGGQGLVIRNLTVRYRRHPAHNPPPVLHGISLNVPAGAKLALVGRTGSAKSTTASALLRLVEPDPGSSIELDGIDCMRLGLADLRTAITLVPQDPILLRGSLRSNLDPRDIHSDADLWQALMSVGFAPLLAAKQAMNGGSGDNGGLYYEIEDGGSNLSQGERQLLALARAILRQPRVIILDEATASTDIASETAAREALKTNPVLKEATVITIAHRLMTVVADHDLVAVLNKGRIVQFGSPLDLMADKTGEFYGMCIDSGEYQQLFDAAKLRQQQVQSMETNV